MVFWTWKKNLIKLLKIYQLWARICWRLPGSVWKSRWSSKPQCDITGNLYTCLFPILLQNKQKPITNSCRKKLWSTPISILSKIEFKILRKKPGDEALSKIEFKILMKKPGDEAFQVSRGADEIKVLPIPIDFQMQKHRVLLLFSIVTPCFYGYLQLSDLTLLIPLTIDT